MHAGRADAHEPALSVRWDGAELKQTVNLFSSHYLLSHLRALSFLFFNFVLLESLALLDIPIMVFCVHFKRCNLVHLALLKTTFHQAHSETTL